MKPTLLCLSGLDPTGGAGIQADIESAVWFGVHALPLLTCLTVQDTRNVQTCQTVDDPLLHLQLAALAADCRVDAMKIGLLSGMADSPALRHWVAEATFPIVLDPILRAGGGATLMQPLEIAAMRTSLFPYMTLITPNAREARALTDTLSVEAAGKTLSLSGPRHVLVTGGDEAGEEVMNRWFSEGRLVTVFRWPRVAGEFHGAGCTLAAAIAACLARGESMESALTLAQHYTHHCLLEAVQIGQGRLLPQRRPRMPSGGAL